MGDKAGEATILNNIGLVHSDLGDKPLALSFFEQALPLRRQVGDKAGEALTCYNMAVIYKGLGDLAQAEQLLARTVELDEAVGHPDLESNRAALERVRAMRRGQPNRRRGGLT